MWSIARIEQLAPDAAAVKAAHGVAKPAKWQGLGRTDSFLWGECAGSGANPYQVRVDLDAAASKCSCPSRKLPCKHALGLLLMMVGGSVQNGTLPAYVQEWIDGRAKRADAKAARATAEEKAPDVEAQARRVEKREARVEAGLQQLEAWLEDIVAGGLAAARAQPAQFWSQMAARLVDAQAPGLARRVGALSGLSVSGEDWQSRLLAGMARVQLLIDAFRQVDKLSPALAAEVRTQIGWTQPQEALLSQDGVKDRWHVLGHRQSQDERLRVQSTWLSGMTSGRLALLLDFAVGNQPLPATYRIGQVFEAELVYFEGAPLLRALVKERLQGSPEVHFLPAGIDVADLQRQFAQLLAENPLLERWPAVLGPVTLWMDGARSFLVDAVGRRVATPPTFRHGWLLTALAGGGAVKLFGQWDGGVFDPMSVEYDGKLFSLARLGELPVLSKVA
jgi:hypothetical protein